MAATRRGTATRPIASSVTRPLAAAGDTFKLGTAGAGFGATTANFKGGIGSASAMVGDITVGALVAVNAAGCVTVGTGPWFWAAPFERDGEFGGRGFPSPLPSGALAFRTKGRAAENTTLAVVATDATLNKVQAKRLAIMAQVGIAHAIRPVHTPLDGDLVFTAATRAPTAARPDPWAGRARQRRRRRACPGGGAGGLRGDGAPVPGRLAGLARSFWNNWITGVPKGSAALTFHSMLPR